MKIPITIVSLIALLGDSLSCESGHAQTVTSPDTTAMHAGSAFQLAIGQKSNWVVVAREVTWTNQYGSQCRSFAVFERNSEQAIAATATNRVCFFRGRLFAVSPAAQSFWITASQPLETQELSEEAAKQLALQASNRPPVGENSTRAHIDLAPLLKQERELRLSPILVLRNVELQLDGERMAVNFESYTGLRGTVWVNEELKLVSESLTTSGN